MNPDKDINSFTDLSGIPKVDFGNPYNDLLDACNNDTNNIQQRYRTHRETRNEQQKAHLTSETFSSLNIDITLNRLLDQQTNPGYVDPRNCLVFWARPTERIRCLIREIQAQLASPFPTLWLMPSENLHMTVMEITHSKPWPEISMLVDIMDSKIPEITSYTQTHRARLVNPMISYDSAAIALSFLPAAGEVTSRNGDKEDDGYTYHHLRRDVYDLCQSTGVEVASRYVVPSSHLTIARFVSQDIFEAGRVKKLVEEIDRLNAELRAKYWAGNGTQGAEEALQWVVGEETGLVCRKGTVWYGGGESHHEGLGF